MSLSLKLSEGNKQAMRGTVLATGETFYIRVKRPSKHSTQLIIDGDPNEVYFTRVSDEDLLYDSQGNITADTKGQRNE